ncbi:MAG: DUF5663 domain-containing protein [Patescibacteria group bacterium]|jgi:hypothetical protein
MTKQSFAQEFITALLSKANLTNADGKIDTDYVDRLAEQLEKKMGLFLLAKLSTEQLEAYYEKVDNKASGEELNQFFIKKIPNFAEEQKKFLDDYAYNFFDRTAKMKDALSK